MLSTGNKKLDDTAPEITGLEYKDETKLEHAKYFKLYHYDKGHYPSGSRYDNRYCKKTGNC